MILSQAAIANDQRIYAIGDVHGCLEHLDDLFAIIERDLAENPVKSHDIIMLGDYVDRGPYNREVIDYLINRQSAANFHCLLGNHDQRMLKFARDPLAVGDNFLQWGGMQTLNSYGVEQGPNKSILDIGLEFAKAIPPSHFEFLENLTTHISTGDYFFCHAGVRPDVALEDQSVEDLVWIRADFIPHTKPYEKVIIHGHTIQDGVPDIQQNRINVDTGCYSTGVLTALVLQGSEYRFLDVKGEPVY